MDKKKSDFLAKISQNNRFLAGIEKIFTTDNQMEEKSAKNR